MGIILLRQSLGVAHKVVASDKKDVTATSLFQTLKW